MIHEVATIILLYCCIYSSCKHFCCCCWETNLCVSSNHAK